ncbi:ATP-grasp domain-containing protein [Dyella sp.]|uniref:ATP-grasp domain-containing protein n=1 Tax=Dyella sp. TaxID=1869338 RepID=UPI002ED08EAA
MPGLVFPSLPFSPREVDPDFADQYAAFKAAGHTVYLIDTDNLQGAKTFPVLADDGEPLIYRGWMLAEEEYTQLQRALGGRLVTTLDAYLSSHHLPRWYPALVGLTLPATWVEEPAAIEHLRELQAGGMQRVFVKDYVKSVKTGQGSGVSCEEDLRRVLDDIRTYKGFIEGGVVFRPWTELDESREIRFFVYGGTVHAPHSGIPEQAIKLARQAALRHDASFYTIDVMPEALGSYKVVEIGDGQVSEPRGWDLDRFAAIFAS